MASGEALARKLADIDQLANDAIVQWGGEAHPSESSLKFLQAAKRFSIAFDVPLEALQGIHRLRLYAYAYDVLALLSKDSSPAVASSARSFVKDVSSAVSSETVLSPEAWSRSLQAILAAPQGRTLKADPEIIHDMVKAVRQVNRYCIPEPANFKEHVASIRTSAFVEQPSKKKPHQVSKQPESHVAWALGRWPREERAKPEALSEGVRGAPLDEGHQIGKNLVEDGFLSRHRHLETSMGPMRASSHKDRSEPYTRTCRRTVSDAITIEGDSQESVDAIVDATPSQPLNTSAGSKAPHHPAQPVLQHRAPASACMVNGTSLVTERRVPSARMTYTRWTPEEEERLIQGHRTCGDRWQMIQVKFKLQNKHPVQLKDKWRNLLKAGRVTRKKD